MLKKVFFILLLVLSLSTSEAAVPRLINYQGRLANSSGSPVVDGSYTVIFKIFEAESGGTPIWQGTYQVTTAKGIFNILLGEINDSGYSFANLAFDKPYFLEIKVGNEIMTPRQQIASAAYAIRAEHGVPRGVIVMWSGSIASIPSGWALCDGTNGTPNLRDKFIIGAGNTYAVAATGGEATHALTEPEMPAHTHTSLKLGGPTQSFVTQNGGGNGAPSSAPDITGSTGRGTPHNNLPPYYALAYIMKL